jgi:hypothetical protein
MALFVSFKKARRFPEVMKKFKRGGALHFDKVVKKAASFVRTPPAGAAVSRSGGQIDVQTITGVAALKKNGKK